MDDLSRLCIHTVTTKPWSIDIAIERYARAGVHGITLWRDAIAGHDPEKLRKQISDAGLEVVSLCRGGFFPSHEAEKRRTAVEENRRVIEEAASVGAPLIVLVCGSDPEQPLETSRRQIEDAIGELAPYAAERGVTLAIEPLHPMYADTKSAFNTLGSANDACEAIGAKNVGVAVDVYHLWWDPALPAEIARCGRNGTLRAFHVCDWRVPSRDFLLDRALMGEGCIDVPSIRSAVDSAGFSGFIEVEIFSSEYWSSDQSAFLERIVTAYREHV